MRWLWERLEQMPNHADDHTLRQYVKCYILLFIGGYLLPDTSNNIVHIYWVPLLRDLDECAALSWGSAALAWTYRSLCDAARRGRRSWLYFAGHFLDIPQIFSSSYGGCYCVASSKQADRLSAVGQRQTGR